jgi:hypothetical protein
MRRVSSLFSLRKASWATLLSLTLFTGVTSMAPVTAGAAPAGEHKPLIPSASTVAEIVPAAWSCTYMLSRYQADAYCNVYSGAIRLRSSCSDSSYVTSEYSAIGPAHLSTDCYPYRRVRSWIDSIG